MRKWSRDPTEEARLLAFIAKHSHNGFNRCNMVMEEENNTVFIYMQCLDCSEPEQFSFHLEKEQLYEQDSTCSTASNNHH